MHKGSKVVLKIRDETIPERLLGLSGIIEGEQDGIFQVRFSVNNRIIRDNIVMQQIQYLFADVGDKVKLISGQELIIQSPHQLESILGKIEEIIWMADSEIKEKSIRYAIYAKGIFEIEGRVEDLLKLKGVPHMVPINLVRITTQKPTDFNLRIYTCEEGIFISDGKRTLQEILKEDYLVTFSNLDTVINTTTPLHINRLGDNIHIAKYGSKISVENAPQDTIDFINSVI